MTKGRVKFSTEGSHHLLPLLTDHLIQHGYAFVDSTDVDLVIQGPMFLQPRTYPKNTRVLVLSDDSVYSDRDYNLKVRPEGEMSEDSPILIPSPLEKKARWAIQALQAEYDALNGPNPALVARVFSVYGPDIKGDLIDRLVSLARAEEDMPVYYPGYQVRTYLHQDDFLAIMDRLIDRLLSGTTGIFNVGSSERISIKRLVDTVWQAVNGVDKNAPLVTLPEPKSYRWWVVPDMTRTKALTQCRPSRSLRAGIWEMT